MTIQVRAKFGPANRLIVVAGLCGFLAWVMWPEEGDVLQHYIVFGVFSFASLFGFLKALTVLGDDLLFRWNLEKTKRPTIDHGSAREASEQEVKKMGMHKPESGSLLGHNGSFPVFAPEKAPFALFEMPPGVGKTSCYVFNSVLHKAKLGYSLVVPDVKPEIAPMLVPALREQGYEVWCINPTEAYLDICGNVEINPFQMVLDSVYAEDDKRLDASTYASDYAELILPEIPGDKQPYFSSGSRRSINVALLSQAIIEPGNCTPSDIYDLLADPEKFNYRLVEIKEFMDTGIEADSLVPFLKSESANLLDRTKNNAENFGSFLEGATQRLLPFNQSGRLGGYGQTAIHNVADIRKRQIIVFIMVPLSYIRDFKAFLSLINYNFIAACKANPSGHPVHFVFDEALNYIFAQLRSNLEVMRALRATAEFYIQSFPGLSRVYGREEAQAIEAYMDVKVYGGLISYERAKFVSDMLAETTIRKEDYSYKSKDAEEINISAREISRKYRHPNEILNMPRGKVWAFVRGMNPMLLDMVHFSQARPWCDWVGEHPVEGKTPPAKPIFELKYPEKE